MALFVGGAASSAAKPEENAEREKRKAKRQYETDAEDAAFLGAGGFLVGASLDQKPPCPEPVPEPAAFAALGVGAAGLAHRRFRKGARR